MDKKKLTLEVIERLKKEYPEAKCTLDYEKAWQLLVSVRLAAQCTDARVDQITPKLYEKFPSVAALAETTADEIEEIVRPCGLGRSKARDISACMKVLHEKYNDNVPDTFEELLALPGVGRKSANLIMGDVFGKPAIVTDTHCIRDQGACQSRERVVEDRAAGGGQRPVPPIRPSWKSRLRCKKTAVRRMLSEGHLQTCRIEALNIENDSS